MGEPKKSNTLGTIASFVPVIGDALSGIIQRAQSVSDVRKQNEYNDPANQLKRLRDAGLPMAAMGNNIANTQSSLPQTNQKGLGNIAQVASTQLQQQQLKLMEAETKNKNAEANRNEAETTYLLSGTQEPYRQTNLTRSLSSEIGTKEATQRGAEIGNRIQGAEADNIKTKINLENSKAITEIGNLLSQRGLINANIKGTELNNKINEIKSRYQEGMSNSELLKLGQEIGLLKKNIEGKKIENDLNALRYEIGKATKEATIFKAEMDAAFSALTYDRVAAEFENYQQYQEFVQRVQDEINKTPWEKIKDPIGTLKSMAAFAYTSITGYQGQSNILNYIK